MLRRISAFLLSSIMVFLPLGVVVAQEGMSYQPEPPVSGTPITIKFAPSENWEYGEFPSSLVIHWGINGEGTTPPVEWEIPDSSLWPSGSIFVPGNYPAVRSPMTFHSEDSTYEITINTDNTFKSVNFVFNSGTPADQGDYWYHNKGGNDWMISFKISWSPFFPNPNDTITIVVRDCDQGGNLYWGVNPDQWGIQTPLTRYWPQGSFLAEDSLGVETPMVGPDTSGQCRVKVGPFKSARQIIDVVDFKIHWDDDSWEPTNYQIYLDHTPQEGDPIVEITSPGTGDTVTSPVNIQAIGSNLVGMEIWGGTDSVAYLESPPYEASWEPSEGNFGRLNITAKGVNGEGRVSFYRVPVEIIPTVVHEPAPEGIDDGVNIDGNQVTFALYAPFKSYVTLVGSFNREYPNGELMKLSGDSLWWLTKSLPDGEYHYQYNLEGIKYIADPWSKDVSWKVPGTDNESSNYEQARTKFVVGSTPFNLTDGDFQRPNLKDIIVYELYVRDFSGSAHPGTYADVLEKLNEGYFDSLGINVIEFMPLNEFEGGMSWGYNPAFYLAPESSYGTPEELKEMIDALHEHGIAVVLDVVFGHMWGTAPLFQLYQPKDDWDYSHHDYDHCPYFHNQASEWGYKLEHWKQVGERRYRTHKYVTDALRLWIEEYHMDGFRFDTSWHIGWEGYNTNGMSYYTYFVNQIDPGVYQIMEEDFYSGPNWVDQTEADANWHFRYHHQMFANLIEGTAYGRPWGDMNYTAKVLDYRNQPEGVSYTISCTGMLNFTESHDEERIIYQCTNYSHMDTSKAVKKSKLGAAITLTSPGLPMLYHGQEFGQDTPKSLDPRPLKWEYLNTPRGLDLFTYYRRLIWLRKNWSVLTSCNYSWKVANSTNKLLVYWREAGDQKIVVVANFDRYDHTLDVPMPNDSTWYEFTLDDTVIAINNLLEDYTIPHSTARIFANYRNWPDAVELESDSKAIAERYSLSQNYPNPFNATTLIRYHLPAVSGQRSAVILKVYNLLGQEVRTLVEGKEGAGYHTVFWDGRNDRGEELASGIYFYRIKAGKFSEAKKLILLK